MAAPIISVIIPVYNVEPYLRECLDSVIRQTFREIEIICINDCSTDGSLAILDEYAAKDSRLKIIGKEKNEGLSAARNTGMSHAAGRYFLFLDSDDCMDRDLCRKANECAEREQAGALIYDFAPFRTAEDLAKNRSKTSSLAGISPSDREALLRFPAFAWTKMIRADLVRSLGLEFPPGLTYEDLPVHWNIMTRASCIAVLPERLYFYRQRSESITYRTDWSLTDRVSIYDLVYSFLVSNNLYDTYRDLFLQSQLEVFCLVYENIDMIHKEKALELILGRLSHEHWAHIYSRKPLHWKTRALFKAIQGSRLARARRQLWFLARACYRRLSSPGNAAQ